MNNLNPIYLIEKSFMSDGVKGATLKYFKNGLKKNGLIKTAKRTVKAAYKRGQHKTEDIGRILLAL